MSGLSRPKKDASESVWYETTMPETLFLVDLFNSPHEVIEFEVLGMNEQPYVGGLIHTIFVTPVSETSRFVAGRAYIIRATTFENQKLSFRFGVHVRQATLLKEEYVKQLLSGDFPSHDYVDRLVDAGHFFTSVDQASEAISRLN
ncbi:MAG: hypothetical protein AAF642_13935 [Pseudomonadota bacterium]